MKEINRETSLKILVAVVIGMAYLVLFWRRLILFSEIPFSGDHLLFYYPSWWIGKFLLADGGGFLWDTYRNMGQPFLASPQNFALYPFRLFSVLFNYVDYQRIFVIFHILIACTFSYLIGATVGKNKLTGILAALLYGFNGFIFWRVLYTADFATIAWGPPILFFLLTRKLIPFSIAVALQWLAGFPPFFIMTQIGLILFGVVMHERRQIFKFMMKGWLIGMGLMAVQLIPFVELFTHSERPLFLEMSEAISHSLPWAYVFLQIVSPSFLRPTFADMDLGVSSFYLGPLFLGLFVWGICRANRTIRVFTFLSFGFLMLSVGKNLPFYSYIPGISFFRYPSHWIFLFILFAVPVAVYGFDKISSRIFQVCLLLLISIDLLAFNFQQPMYWTSVDTFQQVRIFPGLSTHPPGRIYHTDRFSRMAHKNKANPRWALLKGVLIPSYGVVHGVYESLSRSNLRPRLTALFHERLDRSPPGSPLFDFANISTVVDYSNTNDEVLREENIVVRSNAGGDRFHFKGTKLLSVIADRPGYLSVDIAGPGKFIFSEAYFPGWAVYINGKRHKLDLFEGIFLSVELTEGKHRVEFRYFPYSFLIGLFVSLGTLLIILLSLWRIHARQGSNLRQPA